MITNIEKTLEGYLVTINGVVETVPEDPSNRHWYMVQEAIAKGTSVAPLPDPVEPIPQTLSFAQLVVGLVERGWITTTEANGWLAANSLPAAVEAAINTLPATAPDGSMPRLRARARALRPSEIHRSNQLLLLMASMRKATEDDLDDFFRVYAAI